MTSKEKLMLLFFKNRCIKVRLYHQSRSIETRVLLEPKDDNFLTINGSTYYLIEKHMYLENGVRVYTFNAEDPSPAELADWKPSKKQDKKGQEAPISARQLSAAINEKVSQNILMVPDVVKSLKQILIIFGVIVGGLVVALGGFMYWQFENVQELLQFVVDHIRYGGGQ